MNFSTIETALSLPFSIGRNKEKVTDPDPETTKLQQIQLELKQRESEKRNKAQLDANIEFIWPTWNEQTITEHIKSETTYILVDSEGIFLNGKLNRRSA